MIPSKSASLSLPIANFPASIRISGVTVLKNFDITSAPMFFSKFVVSDEMHLFIQRFASILMHAVSQIASRTGCLQLALARDTISERATEADMDLVAAEQHVNERKFALAVHLNLILSEEEGCPVQSACEQWGITKYGLKDKFLKEHSRMVYLC